MEIKSQWIVVGIFIVILTGVFFYFQGNNKSINLTSLYTEDLNIKKEKTIILFEDVTSSYEGKLPIGHSTNQYYYNNSIKVMTDSNGMTYKTEFNGVITINDERYMAFALKGMFGEQEIIKTSLDYMWTWHKELNGKDVTFWAENNDPNLIWRQYYYFYDDPFKPMKIKHYIENNFSDITNLSMYYLFNVLEGDSVEYSETLHDLTEIIPIHKKGNFNNLTPRLNFNADYDFLFEDLINDGFIINEFYVGSGSVLGRPNINITAIGFTKNNGNFPKGSSFTVDPTFATIEIQGVQGTPIDDRTFVLAWCDETGNDAEFAIYDTNGTLKVGPIIVNNNIQECSALGREVSVSALNSSIFVFVYIEDGTVDDVTFKMYDVSGINLTGDIDVDTNAGDPGKGVSSTAINSTSFIIAWIDDDSGDASFTIYHVDGSNLTGEIDVDTTVGGGAYGTSVSAFNDTTFVYGWSDDVGNDATFRIYNTDGTNLTDNIDIDTSAASDESMFVSAFNETAFVIAYFDDFTVDDMTFAIYNSAGNEIKGLTDVDANAGTNNGPMSMTVLNETSFVFTWKNLIDTALKFATFDSVGNELIPETNITTTSIVLEPYSQTVLSYEFSTNIGICDDNFIVAWANSTSLGLWEAFQSNGTLWDGLCEDISADTCDCAGLNNNWEIDHSDACVISVACDLGTGKLSFIGTGITTCQANIKTSDLGDPGSGGTLQIDSSCLIEIS